ncbi:MAG: adenylate/guanylate cyclase domain-containing protein [Candidatus Riflebacteria bacterium]
MEKSAAIIQQILTENLTNDDIHEIVSRVKAGESGNYSEALASILDRVGSLLNVSERLLDNLLLLLVEITSDIAHAERGTLFLVDSETGELFSRVVKGSEVEEIRFPMNLGIAGTVLENQDVLTVGDAYSDPRFNSDIDKKTGYQTKNLLCLPVRVSPGGSVIGVLELLNLAKLPLDPVTMQVLEKVTANSGKVLKNAHQFEQIQQARENESHLLELASVISSELQLKPLLEKIMEAVIMILNCDRATIFLHDEKTNELWSQVALGMNQEIRIPANRGIAGEVFSTGCTVNIPDAYKDSRFNQQIDLKTGYRTRNILCMPLINKHGIPIGVTQVLNKRGGAFNRADEKKLRSFSAQASIAIENAKLFNEVFNMKNYSESILRSLSNGVISVNHLRKIEKCNGIACRILGADEGKIIGRFSDITFTGDNHWIVDSLRRVIATNDSDSFIDAEITNMQGKKVSVNMSVVPLRSISDEPMGGLLIMEDLSIEKRMKGTLARYMTKEIADQLMDSDGAELGGQIKELSILFSDIRNFTTISEKLGPQETVAMLNEYFSTMVDIVFHHGGILDKFIGDAMLGVFGAPFSSDEDADKAVCTAVDMMKALKQFNANRMLKNQQVINIGIGIATDNVLVGNIGSIKRMDYTVIGDGVNLASRLEGATKFYHADILISEKTCELLKYRYFIREVDLIRVKGKTLPVKVFEVLDHHDKQTFPEMEQVIGLTHQGIDLYRQQRWQEAIDIFNSAIRLNRKDELCKMYVVRCNFFMENPPAPDWDGVWTMTTKS